MRDDRWLYIMSFVLVLFALMLVWGGSAIRDLQLYMDQVRATPTLVLAEDWYLDEDDGVLKELENQAKSDKK